MRKFSSLVLVLCFASLVGCKTEIGPIEKPSVWSDPNMWYQSGDTICADKIDFFYLVSTNVMSSTDSLGNVLYRSVLNEEDREAIGRELKHVKKYNCQDDYNFIAPYYHQYNFEALSLPESEFAKVYPDVAAEVCEAFDYYMEHINQGRPFALVGFSQGSMLIIDLLKHMTDKQYGQMVGAYMMGYRLSAEDLQHPHIVAAQDEVSRGVTVSFNSVMSLDGVWPKVADKAAAAINPVNWKTDSTPAQFVYRGDSLTATLDEASHLLLVDVPDPETYREWMRNNPAFSKIKVSENCLHHWDLLFYEDKIHENIKIRTK